MIARYRIWEELKQAKINILCLQKYIDQKRYKNRWYNAFVTIIASVGALGYTINESVPLWTSIAIALISIIKSTMPNFLQTELELSELDSLSDFYARYMNSLESIWYEYDKESSSEKETMSKFFKLKETECDKESALNRGIHGISKRKLKEIDLEASHYINSVYFEKSDDE